MELLAIPVVKEIAIQIVVMLVMQNALLLVEVVAVTFAVIRVLQQVLAQARQQFNNIFSIGVINEF